MKRIALAAALVAATAGSAMAQSSVTLYGRLNTSIEQQDNDVIDKTVMQNNASRWGLRGNEDLGGGLSAFFQLESGFGSDTGSGGATLVWSASSSLLRLPAAHCATRSKTVWAAQSRKFPASPVSTSTSP